jgi:hypothetical protein
MFLQNMKNASIQCILTLFFKSRGDDLFISFNLGVTECKKFSYYKRRYENYWDNYREQLNVCLRQSILECGEIDSTAKQADEFSQLRFHVMISHAPKDTDIARSLAGWLYDTFGLTAVIDSEIWGYSSALMELLSESHLPKETIADGRTLYDFEDCVCVSSYVNSMLFAAVQKIIDETEVVLFLNSDNLAPSDEPDSFLANAGAPWLYTQMVSANYVRRKPLNCYRYYNTRKSNDITQDYATFLTHNLMNTYYHSVVQPFVALDCELLGEWESKYILEQYTQYPLDALYDLLDQEIVATAKSTDTIMNEVYGLERIHLWANQCSSN